MNIKYSLYLTAMAVLLTACVSGEIPSYSDRVPDSSDNRDIGGVRVSHLSHRQFYPEIVIYAMSLLGMPYTYGGSSRSTGFDCSGLVLDIYQQTLQIRLPRTAREMAEGGIPISKNQLKIGDLVFFNTTGQMYSHVGLYLGNSRFLHAPNSKSVVQIGSLDNSYWRSRFSGARTYFVK